MSLCLWSSCYVVLPSQHALSHSSHICSSYILVLVNLNIRHDSLPRVHCFFQSFLLIVILIFQLFICLDLLFDLFLSVCLELVQVLSCIRFLFVFLLLLFSLPYVQFFHSFLSFLCYFLDSFPFLRIQVIVIRVLTGRNSSKWSCIWSLKPSYICLLIKVLSVIERFLITPLHVLSSCSLCKWVFIIRMLLLVRVVVAIPTYKLVQIIFLFLLLLLFLCLLLFFLLN